MKKILLMVLGLFFVSAGVILAQSNTQEAKENSKMNKKILVAYFSATGNTRRVAQNLAKAVDADIYEIKPAKAYSDADLDWTNKSSRSSVEMADHSSRPEIIKDDFSVKDYETIYLGFPIWWYIAPTIVNTFLEKHDFSNKKIILFATSGGSGLGKSIDNIKTSVSDSTKVINGKVFNTNISVEELKNWVETIK